MTAALEGGEWSAARPGCTLPPGKTRYPFYRRLGGPKGRSGRAENSNRVPSECKHGAFAFFGVSSNLTESLAIKHSVITSSSRDSRISCPTTTAASTTPNCYLFHNTEFPFSGRIDQVLTRQVPVRYRQLYYHISSQC